VEDFGIKMLCLYQAFGECDFNRACHQLILNGFSVGNFQFKFDVGMLPVKLAEDLWQQVSAYSRAGAHGQAPAFESAKFLNCPRRFLLDHGHALNILRQKFSAIGEPAAAWQPFQQAHPHGVFQFFDLFGDSGLADMQPFGTSTDAASLGDGMKQRQMISIHWITVSYVSHINNVFVLYHAKTKMEFKYESVAFRK